jgi:hypothetical protein
MMKTGGFHMCNGAQLAFHQKGGSFFNEISRPGVKYQSIPHSINRRKS